jgi:hypothetical protein
MEGRAATDLAKQCLRMTTFLGLLERPRESYESRFGESSSLLTVKTLQA